VSSSTIQNAGLVDRDVFDVLPFMAPQVSPGLDMVATSGGAREAGTSYMLNGAEDNNNFSAGAMNINPPLESVEDFSIITNSMGAQYGRGMGAVVSANQKSGSNKFHGVLYEQNRNASLNANDFFYNREPGNAGTRPKYIKNQFGGTVGGPIKKDKTFFFFAYDRLKLDQGVTSADTFVPTTAGLAYLTSHLSGNGSGSASVSQTVLANYPPATSDAPCPGQGNYFVGPNGGTDTGVPTTGAGTNPFTGLPNTVGCLTFADPQITTNDAYYARVDHNFSSSDRLSFAANVNRDNFTDQFGGGGLLGNGSSGFVGIPNIALLNNHNLALTETHTFSPRVANELTISQIRFYNPGLEGDPSKQKSPNMFVDNQNEGGLNYQFGPGEGGQVVGFTQDRWELKDNLIWTVGRHNFKVGGSANYGILYRNWDLGLPGQYEFGELYSVDAPPDANNNPAPCAATASCPAITPANDIGSDGNPVLQPNGTIANVINEPNSNIAADYPYFMETSIDPRTGAKANAYRHYTSHDYAVFAQDDWKITSRLTLNLGLRWERFGAPSEDHGNIAQFTNFAGCDWAHDATCIAAARTAPVSRMWNTNNKDFGPRIGFAYDPFGKGTTAIRGGYGIFYDRIFDNIWSNGAWNPPFYALADLEADIGNTIFYANPASVGAAYVPNTLPGALGPVSVRTMDVNMRDSSGQNFYLGAEHQFFGGLLLRASYQGSMGSHLPMLENVNRVDGIGYNASLKPVRPNPLYTGFNYRSNSVSSNYNALILEATKRMSHGLQFNASYTRSKQLDVNSELFAGCSSIGALTAPYYYISNAQPHRNYAPGAENHPNAFKFNVTYELPFLKSEKGFVGHALGGWSLGSFFQFYSGHPVDVYNGMSRKAAHQLIPFGGTLNDGTACAKAAGCSQNFLDPSGIPYNIGGDYNLDGVLNDHPIFIGSNINAVYSGKNPADGIFIDGNRMGCGFMGMPAGITNLTGGVCGSGNSLFTNPAYPGSGLLFERFGTLGRDVFHGPRFVDLDFALHKTFKITETMNLRFSAEAQNLANHPNFDGVQANINSSRFGQAEFVDGGAGNPTQKSRVMSLSLRLAF
jgi:TonB dependent receptor